MKKIDGLTEEEYFGTVVAQIETVTDAINNFCAEHRVEINNYIESLNVIKDNLEKIENSDVPNDNCSWDDAHSRVSDAIMNLYSLLFRMDIDY